MGWPRCSDARCIGYCPGRLAWAASRGDRTAHASVLAGLSDLAGVETDPTNLALSVGGFAGGLQPFAPDVGSIAGSSPAEVGYEGDSSDTRRPRRSFRFVVAWVLRWEVSSARYERGNSSPSSCPVRSRPSNGAPTSQCSKAPEVETLGRIGGWTNDPTLGMPAIPSSSALGHPY